MTHGYIDYNGKRYEYSAIPTVLNIYYNNMPVAHLDFRGRKNVFTKEEAEQTVLKVLGMLSTTKTGNNRGFTRL